ncbi:hypothetical protein FXO38_03658 [Capsicum annuum]|nr:hypothetical protein FXO37_23803 [Capsicum annuum]KAF3677687.1 hypothetical protein FXO38_03658 [Capsicum annuum]
MIMSSFSHFIFLSIPESRILSWVVHGVMVARLTPDQKVVLCVQLTSYGVFLELRLALLVGPPGTRKTLLAKIASFQTSFDEAQKKISAMQYKYELENSKSEKMLNALRTVAGSVRLDGEGANISVVSEKQMNGEVVEPYEAELEAIINAIKNKENKVEEMHR